MRGIDLTRWILGCAALGCVALAPVRDASAAGSPADAAACIQASEQGQSERDEGKYRAARESFLQCSRDVCPAVIVKSCAGWLRDLDQMVPTVVLGAKDAHGEDLADVTVTLDGAPFATKLDGKPLPVDGGEHVFRFEREGTAPKEQKLILRAGEKSRVVTVVLAAATSGDDTTPTEPDHEPAPPEPLLSPHHVTAAALLLGGLGSAGMGLYFTLQSNSAAHSAASMRGILPQNACSNSTSMSCQNLSNTVSTQHSDATAATALFIAGGALAASSIATWLFWPKRSAAPAQHKDQSQVVTPFSSAALGAGPVPGGAVVSISGSFF